MHATPTCRLAESLRWRTTVANPSTHPTGSTSERSEVLLMRHPERALTDPAAIDDVLQRGTVCHLAMVDGERPYVVPLCYGYREGALYIHCAREGHKVDVLRRNPAVCFEVSVDVELRPASRPCRWSVRYRSVIGTGRATLVDAPDEVRAALDVIMAHYSVPPGKDARYAYGEAALANTLIIRIDVESLSGKENR